MCKIKKWMRVLYLNLVQNILSYKFSKYGFWAFGASKKLSYKKSFYHSSP